MAHFWVVVSRFAFVARALVLIAVALLPLLSASAQQSDGTNNLPAFGSFSGSDFDIVSLQNGNLHMSIPIESLSQRGGKPISYMYIYDTPAFSKVLTQPKGHGSPYWQITPDTQFYQQVGWFLSNSLNWVQFQQWQNKGWTCPDNPNKFTLTTFGIMDPQRAKHPLYLLTSTAPCVPPQLVAPALDGSGMLLDKSTSNKGVIFKDGTRPSEDANGNLFNATLDTLNRNPLTVTTGPIIAFTTPLGTQLNGPQYQTWTFKDSNGIVQTWTLNNEAIDVNTSAGLCPPPGPIQCFDLAQGALVVPQNLILPTGAHYQFVYNNNSSGELQEIVLPTGGSISYTYDNGYNCISNPLTPESQDCRIGVTSRTVTQAGSASKWTYNRGLVTDPNGNDEVHSFNYLSDPNCLSAGSYETQVQYWSGSSAPKAGGTVLKTVSTSYKGDDITEVSDLNNMCLYNVRPISQNTTLGSGSTAVTRGTQTDYETFVAAGGYTATRMNVTALREYDYASGLSPGSLLRQTTNAYGLNSNSIYTTLNIVDRVTQKTVYDGGSHQAAQTINEYDNYSHTAQPMVASGAVQHDPNFGTTYKTRGNATAVSQWRNTDGALLTTTNQFDDAGNVLSRIDPLGNKTSFDFTDSWSNSTCAPSGQGKAYVTKITNALSQFASKSYDSCSGAIASTKDPNMQVTGFSYDMLGRTTQVTYPDGGLASYCYSDVGGTCTQSGPPYQVVSTKAITASPLLNEVSTAVYDGLGRLSQTQLNSDSPTTYTLTTYDSLGRKYKTYNPTRCNPVTSNCGETTWGYTTYNYDPLGRVTSVVEQDNSTVSTNYPGSCTTVTDELGISRESCVDGMGRLTGVWEDSGTAPHLNYETDYQYDVLGNLTNVAQKGSNSATARTRSFTYDSLSHLVCSASPEIQSVTCPASATGIFPVGAVTYTYDNDGNLSSKVSPAPDQPSASVTVTLNQSYDALNRLTKKTYSDVTMPTIQYGYDGVALSGCITTPPGLTDTYPVGGRTAMCDGSGGTSWSHDQLGRVLQERRTIGGAVGKYVNYTYHLDGSLFKLTTPPLKTIVYTYNGAARAISAVDSTDGINFATGAIYAPPGELASIVNGLATGFAGFTTTNSYNKRLQPAILSAASPSATVLSLSYNFNLGSGDNGDVIQIVNNRDNTRTQNFMYDSLNRIQQAYSSGTQWGETFSPTTTSPGVAPSTPGIDAWGNLTNRSGVTGKTMYEPLSTSAGTNNQLSGYGYDAAGNMTSNGSTAYVYDAENRLVWTSGYKYVYDGNGDRVEKCVAATSTIACPTSGTNGILYWRNTGAETLDESDLSGNALEEFIFFNGQRIARRDVSTNLMHYYFSDHLGSHGVVENATGSACEQDIDYYPYGGVEYDYCPNVAQNYKFTGKERDTESGLDYFGKRFHASSLGRVMSVDPHDIVSDAKNPKKFGTDLLDPQGWNRYAYVTNNPLKFADWEGLEKYLVVYVQQPVPGTSKTYDQKGFQTITGHAFIGLKDTTAHTETKAGFYPKDTVIPEISTTTTGVVKDDSNHSWNVSQGYKITDDQYNAVQQSISNDKGDTNLQYDLNTNNCTDWVMDTAGKAGITLPDATGTWPGGGGESPGPLGQELAAQPGATVQQPKKDDEGSSGSDDSSSISNSSSSSN